MAHFITSDNGKIYIEDEISFKMISPLQEKKNSYSLPFNIPLTPETSLFFERAELVDAKSNKVRVMEGTLVMDIISFIGVLRLTRIEDKYRCNFTGQNRLYCLLNKQKLTEMDLGDIELSEFFDFYKTEIDDFYFKKNGKKAYCFPPIQNIQAYEKYSFDVLTTDVLNFLYIGIYGAPRYHPSMYYYMPAYFLNFLVKYILENLGFYVNRNVLDDKKFENIFVVSNYIITDHEFTELEGDHYQFDVEAIIIDESDNKVILQLEEKSMVNIFRLVFIKLYDLNIEEHL
ncbi:hypothetical protein ES708_10593 [subsurface metagenome]